MVIDITSNNVRFQRTSEAHVLTKSCSGLTEHNQLTTVQRAHLVSEHIEKTSQKTRSVIDDVRGGTLLIDEVYRLSSPGSSRDFGREAHDAIMSAIESEEEKKNSVSTRTSQLHLRTPKSPPETPVSSITSGDVPIFETTPQIIGRTPVSSQRDPERTLPMSPQMKPFPNL